MYTPPDGQSPIMQMYLWTNPYRAMNGGDDASIVYHEYTHGLTNRLVTDADGAGALNSAQAGAMGEGWSDFYAKDFLVSQWPSIDTRRAGRGPHGRLHRPPGHEHDPQPGARLPGRRHERADCCQGRGPGDRGGYTYGDFGKIGSGPEVHDDGEIWAETLWDLRTAVGVDGRRAAHHRGAAAVAAGAVVPGHAQRDPAGRRRLGGTYRARDLGGLRRARDGLLRQRRRRQRHHAARGLLAPARARRAARDDHRHGDATALTPHLPLAGVTVSVGANAAGPDALTATTDVNGVYTLSVPPGTYPTIVVRRTGYERVIASMTIAANETKTLDAQIKRDWAAREGGAILRSTAGSEYTSYGCGPGAAIDNNQSITWSTDYTASQAHSGEAARRRAAPAGPRHAVRHRSRGRLLRTTTTRR